MTSCSVRLVEAIPSAGALRFEMLSEGKRLTGAAVAFPRAAAGQAPAAPLPLRGGRGRRPGVQGPTFERVTHDAASARPSPKTCIAAKAATQIHVRWLPGIT